MCKLIVTLDMVRDYFDHKPPFRQVDVINGKVRVCVIAVECDVPVSYTHLRAHET